MTTIDTELSATALSSEQLATSKIYVFVTSKRKIIGAVVAARVEHAFSVVDAASRGTAVDLIDFGNESTALFCSYVRKPLSRSTNRANYFAFRIDLTARPS